MGNSPTIFNSIHNSLSFEIFIQKLLFIIFIFHYETDFMLSNQKKLSSFNIRTQIFDYEKFIELNSRTRGKKCYYPNLCDLCKVIRACCCWSSVLFWQHGVRFKQYLKLIFPIDFYHFWIIIYINERKMPSFPLAFVKMRTFVDIFGHLLRFIDALWFIELSGEELLK